MPFHHQSGFLDDVSYSALPPAETANNISSGAATSFPAQSTVQNPYWGTASHGSFVPETREYPPSIPDSWQSYPVIPVGSIPASSHLGMPSIFPFDQSHGLWDGYHTATQYLDGQMGQSRIMQPRSESVANTGIDLRMPVNPPSVPVHSSYQALELAYRNCGTIVNVYGPPSGQASGNGYRGFHGQRALSSAQSFVYPDADWNAHRKNGQRTVSNMEDLVQGHLGFNASRSVGSVYRKSPAPVGTAEIPDVASFGMRPTVSMLRSSRYSKPHSTAASIARQISSSNASSRSHRTEAIKAANPRPRKGIPHLFRRSMYEYLPPNDLYAFVSVSCGISSEQCYIMLLGEGKVSATKRITDMVLNPTAPESTMLYVKRILQEIVRCMQQSYSVAQATKSEALRLSEGKSTKTVSVNSSIAKQQQLFQKAFAICLMEDLSESERSIWVASPADNTPQCWNVRMSKLIMRVKKHFDFSDAKFPDDPSNPSEPSEQGSRGRQ